MTTRIKLLGVVAGLALTASMGATKAEAASLTVNFCPGDSTCPANITEASLTFDEVMGGDVNDYIATIRIVGDASIAAEPTFIDSVQFKVDGTDSGDYEFQPILQTFPAAGAPWEVYWDNISNAPGACTSDGTGASGLCSNSTGAVSGALVDGINEWTFLVDFVDSYGPLEAGDPVNLRAEFDNADMSNFGILSPGGGDLTTTTTTDDLNVDTDTVVAEPATLILVGLSLGLGAHRARRKQQRP